MNKLNINEKIPIKYIDYKYFENFYREIGSGSEGTVYKYDNKKAIKIFDISKFPCKLNKVKSLYSLSDSNFCFPTGLIYTDKKNLVGYEMDLIECSYKYKNFLELFLDFIPNGLIDINELFSILFSIDNALKRVHDIGYTVGDLRPKNILINNDNIPIFIDTDSGAYNDFNYDLSFSRLNWAKDVYKHSFSYEDNDKYVWAIIFLEAILMYNNFNKKTFPFMSIELYQDKKAFDYLINHL